MSQILTITLTDEGQIHVTGPLTDKILCYGLLMVAHDVIRAHAIDPSAVVRPPSGLVIPRN